MLTDNLISYYKLDEASGNAADSHGANTLTNNASTPFATGKINNGADFGTGNTTKYFSKGSVLTSATTNISMVMWIKLLSTSEHGTYIHNGKADGGDGYSLGVGGTTFDNNGNNLIFLLDSVAWHNTTAAIGAAGWHQIAVTRDATTWRFYIDGAAAGSTLTTNPNIPTANFFLGTDYNISTERFASGMLDEVGVWSRELTSAEITSLYNGGAGLAYPFTTTSAKPAFFMNFV